MGRTPMGTEEACRSLGVSDKSAQGDDYRSHRIEARAEAFLTLLEEAPDRPAASKPDQLSIADAMK